MGIKLLLLTLLTCVQGTRRWDERHLPWLLMGGLVGLVLWGSLVMGEPSNLRGKPKQIPGPHYRARDCHRAKGYGGFWGRSEVVGDLGEPVPG